jgi:hypothetical protein
VQLSRFVLHGFWNSYPYNWSSAMLGGNSNHILGERDSVMQAPIFIRIPTTFP